MTQLTELLSLEEEEEAESHPRLPVCSLTPLSFPQQLTCASQAVVAYPQGRKHSEEHS